MLGSVLPMLALLPTLGVPPNSRNFPFHQLPNEWGQFCLPERLWMLVAMMSLIELLAKAIFKLLEKF